MTEIYFRTDGNSEIATGHLMRCLTIARACRHRDAAVTFIVSDEESLSLLRERFALPQEFTVCCLHTDYRKTEQEIPALLSCLPHDTAGSSFTEPEAPPRDSTANASNRQTRPWLFIDSYYAAPAYFQTLRRYFRVAYLDDLRRFDCAVDLLINYDTTEDCACYDRAVRKLLGPQYTPLREQFHNVAYEVRPTAGHVLLSTGGTDPCRIAETLLGILYPESIIPPSCPADDSASALQEHLCSVKPERFESEALPLLRSLHYHVLTSRSNTSFEALTALARVCPSVHIHTNVQNVAALMASCDLAVSAGGTTLCELCAVGVPSVSYLMAENQRTAVETFAKEELIPCAGDLQNTDLPDISVLIRILNLLADMARAPKARAAVSTAMRSFLDGSGADKIAAALTQ